MLQQEEDLERIKTLEAEKAALEAEKAELEEKLERERAAVRELQRRARRLEIEKALQGIEFEQRLNISE